MKLSGLHSTVGIIHVNNERRYFDTRGVSDEYLTARTARGIVLCRAPPSEDVRGRLVRAAEGRMSGGLEPSAVTKEQAGFEGVFESHVHVDEAAHPGTGAGHDAGAKQGTVLWFGINERVHGLVASE